MKKLRPQDIKIGDSVKVKKGKKNDYLDKYIVGGYEGRVFDKYKMDDYWTIEVEFDSITLKSMTGKYLRDNIKNGVDYACMDFSIDSLLKSKARDTMQDVKAARKVIQKKTGFLSILDEKGEDVWKMPREEVTKDKPKAGEKIYIVSKAKERDFNIQYEKVQKKKELARKEADKLDPNKKIDVIDFLKWVTFPKNIVKALLGEEGKKRPFRYIEDITKEKFLTLPGIKKISWYQFQLCLTQNVNYTKYHNTAERLFKHFKIDFEEVMTNLFPGVELKMPKGKSSKVPVIGQIRIEH